MSERHKKQENASTFEDDTLPRGPDEEGDKKIQNPFRQGTVSTTDMSSGLESTGTSTNLGPPTGLDPPATWSERFRDALLQAIDHPVAQGMNIVVILAVIVVGAFFFFYLVGWQPSCRPRTDCQPRNDRYNVSVQILTALFTYMVTASLSWRVAHFLHVTGCHGRKGRQVGCDLYGVVSNDIWFHIPPTKRLGILCWFLLNCLTQYANQAARIVYSSYEEQAVFPGNLWTNIFFGTSFVCAFVGSLWLLYEEALLRKQHPGKFGPGPVELAKSIIESIRSYVCPNKETLDVEGSLAAPSDAAANHPAL